MKKVEEEPWRDCIYHPADSNHSRDVLDEMKCNHEDNNQEQPINQTDPKQYLADLKDAPG